MYLTMIETELLLHVYLGYFFHAYWSRAMFDKSTDHGNDGGVICFSLFLMRTIFLETYMEMDIETTNHLLIIFIFKKNQQQFSIVCTFIDHRNNINITFKTLQ